MPSVTLTVTCETPTIADISGSAIEAGCMVTKLSPTCIHISHHDIDSIREWGSSYDISGIQLEYHTFQPTRNVTYTPMADISGITSNLLVRPPGASWFSASMLATIYEYPPPLPTPVVVGIITFDGNVTGTVDANGVLSGGDIFSYWTDLGIASSNFPKVIMVDTARNPVNPRGNSNPNGEDILDISFVGGTCPSANLTIILYRIYDFITGFDYILNTPVVVGANSYKPSIISVSWGIQEVNAGLSFATYFDNFIAPHVANGINICVASGDGGAGNGLYPAGVGYSIGFPGCSANIVNIGGTQLYCPNGVYDSSTFESVWSPTASIPWEGSGGGYSLYIPKPAYQNLIVPSVANNPAIGINTANRSIPDLALVSSDQTPLLFYMNGGGVTASGTSFAAPTFAGFLACIQPKKFINPIIYSLIGTSVPPSTQYTNYFHDITTGNNGGFEARPGYDTCTGFGSIKGTALALPLSSAPILRLGCELQ